MKEKKMSILYLNYLFKPTLLHIFEIKCKYYTSKLLNIKYECMQNHTLQRQKK